MKQSARERSGRSRPAFRLDKTLKTLRDHLPELRARYGVRSLWLFGSHVRGSQRKRSDLDVLVELDDRSLSLLKFVELEHYLCDLVGVNVDLVEKETLKPAIGRHILEEVVSV